MSASKTLAFVLKKTDYRDTSLLTHFYTREAGKIHGIVKGIRDTRARFGSTLEPFSLNEILYYRKKRGSDLCLVTHAECLDDYPALRADLEKLSYASYFSELVDELTGVEDADPGIFDLMKDGLDFLVQDVSPRRAARIFELKLLEALGLMPETRQCVVCRAEMPDPAFFSPSYGGIRCAGCHARAKDSVPAQKISRGALNFIEHVGRSEWAALRTVKVSAEVGADLEKMLRRFLDHQLTHKLHTVVFLEKVGLAS